MEALDNAETLRHRPAADRCFSMNDDHSHQPRCQRSLWRGQQGRCLAVQGHLREGWIIPVDRHHPLHVRAGQVPAKLVKLVMLS